MLHRENLRNWLFALVLASFSASALADSMTALTGNVAVWHNQSPIPVTVELLPFAEGKYLANDLVELDPLPQNLVPDDKGCFCFSVDDDRFVYVHTYYYATKAISNYNKILKELNLPTLHGVTIKLAKDRSMPSSGSATYKDNPKIEMTYPNSTLDVFQLDHEIGHLVDYLISPRAGILAAANLVRSEEENALEGGVAEGTANILSALELGMTGSDVFTDETLDVPPSNDIDNFVRFPDLIVTRRQVLEGLTTGPKFAVRYGDFVNTIKQNLQDPAMESYLQQPDEYAASAVINQPLWKAAVQFGFKNVKIVYLQTLANWNGADVNYNTLAQQLVTQAAKLSPEMASFLRQEFTVRGLVLAEPR